MRKILLLWVLLSGVCVNVYASRKNIIHQKDIPRLVFENLEKKYIDECIAKLQQLHLVRVVPGELLLIYFERLSQEVFKVKAFVGRPGERDVPHRNFRYEKHKTAQSILHEIAVYVDEQFQEPGLLKYYVDTLDVGLGVLIGFSDEDKMIGQQSSFSIKSRCNSKS